jgi:hypothetical protein
VRILLLLGAGLALAACAHRAEETGAAPDQGDTTAVTHAIDSQRPDSVAPGMARDTAFVGQDTPTPGGLGGLSDSVQVDSSGVVTDTTQAGTVGNDSTQAPRQ